MCRFRGRYRLGGALALLHLIRFEEPFGLSFVESLACSTPVIAFPKGSTPEILTDKKNGFIVRDVPAAVDAVSRLSSIDRAACRKTAEERFADECMVDGYLGIYQKIVAG